MATSQQFTRRHRGREAVVSNRESSHKHDWANRNDQGALLGLPFCRRARPEIFQLFERFHRSARDVSWAHFSTGKSDCELHTVTGNACTRAPMEPPLSA